MSEDKPKGFPPAKVVADILAQPKDAELSGRITFAPRHKELNTSDRMALVMLTAMLTEYPNATNGQVQEALVNAIWWHQEIASYRPVSEQQTPKEG